VLLSLHRRLPLLPPLLLSAGFRSAGRQQRAPLGAVLLQPALLLLLLRRGQQHRLWHVHCCARVLQC
jgi:hypothetical protein